MAHTINGIECAGAVSESKLKELLPPMPLMFIKVRRDRWNGVTVACYNLPCNRKRKGGLGGWMEQSDCVTLHPAL